MDAFAVADDTGGVGGVGLALLFGSGVSFTYLNADGKGYMGLNSVFPHTYSNGDWASLNNFNGSFVVSLYDSANHLTKAAVSGCMP